MKTTYSSRSHLQGVMLLVLTMMILMIAGCATSKVNTEVVYETKTVYVTPDPLQLRPVIAPRPMAKETYLALKDYERESYLGDYALDLLGKLGVCNAQLQSIESTVRKVTGGTP